MPKYYLFEVELTGGYRKITYQKVEENETPEEIFFQWAASEVIIESAWSERQYGNRLVPKHNAGEGAFMEVFEDETNDSRVIYFRLFFNNISIIKERKFFPLDTEDSEISMELENWVTNNFELFTEITEVKQKDYEYYVRNRR